MVKSANGFCIAILHWSHPFYTMMEEEMEGDSRDDGTREKNEAAM